MKIKKGGRLDEMSKRERFIKANATVPFEVELDEVVSNVLVSREFISSFFGGSPQDAFPPVSKRQ